MASFVIFSAILFLAGRIIAGPVQTTSTLQGSCQQFNIPITASASGAIFDKQQIDNDIEASAWAIKFDTWSSPKGIGSALQNINISGTYNIHAQLCIPDSSAKSNILQIATHGLYFDSRYWDSDLVQDSSYVKSSLGAGYSILTYDRLGTGQSDKPDAYKVVQAPFELEILHQITIMARNGSLAKFAMFPAQVPAFQKIVHVGHSFGSLLSSAYISVHGSFSDGAILTGYVPNKYLGSSSVTSFDLSRASDLPTGYVIQTRGGFQNIFFAGNNSFTAETVYTADKSLKQAIAIAQLSSAYALAPPPDGSFQGPLQYFMPEFDFFICKGDCKDTYNETQLKKLFPNTSALEVYVQPNTGHGLTLHKNATAGYEVMFDFLARNGL